MFYAPKKFILMLVGLSILVAFFVTQLTLNGGEISFSSSSPQELSVQIRDILAAGKNVSKELLRIGAPGAQEVYNCNCVVGTTGIDSPYFQFEEATQCGDSRNYLEEGLSKIPLAFRDDRAKKPADFPRACLTYILRKFLAGTESASSPLFARCANFSATPQKGSLKPCVTKNYVNAVYNSFGDLATCFNVPQRDFLPKLYNESGFHINALGAGYDAGVSQVVGPTIDYANQDFQKYKNDLLSSKSESCKRVAPLLRDLKPASDAVGKRCEVMTPPANPILNLFYLMIKYKQDQESIQNYMTRPEFDIAGRLKRLGLDPSQYDESQMKQMLMILSFNAGARGAVLSLKNYLQAIETAGRKLSIEDFQIGRETMIYLRVKQKTGVLTRNPGDDNDKWKSRLKKFEEMAEALKDLDLKYKPKVEKTTAKFNSKTYSTYKLSWNVGQLSFPAYLMLYQTTGSDGYLNYVKRAADELNRVFKEGTCVPESYLSL